MRDGDVRERDASVDGDVDVYLRLGRRLFHLDERGGYEMRADENRASRLRGYPTVGEPHAESLARFEFRPEHVRRRDARARAARVPPRASDVRVVLVQRAVRVRRDDDRVIPLRSLRAVRGRPPRRRVEIRVGVRTVSLI